MTTHLKVVWEKYRLRFRSRATDYDWLDDALWVALEFPTRVDTVRSWFGVGDAILLDAIARLLLRGVLLIDPNAGTIHRTGDRPAPGTDRMTVVDVWQDQRTGIIISLHEADSELGEGFLVQPPAGTNVVTFADSTDPGPLWPRILELSDAELYAALPVRSRPPHDRDVGITRERQGWKTLYCQVWEAPGRGIAFPSIVPSELRTYWRRCRLSGTADTAESVPRRDWDEIRSRYQTWNQLVGAWEVRASEWLDDGCAALLDSVTARASAVARVWLDRPRLSRGRFEVEALHGRLRDATHSVVLRWAVPSELRELLAAIPPGLEIIVYAAKGEAAEVSERGSLHRFELDEELASRLPRCLALIDAIDLWRVGEAVRGWPDRRRGRSCLRLSSGRALDKVTEVLRGLPGNVALLHQGSIDATDIRADRIVEAAAGFVSQFEGARRRDEARRADADPEESDEQSGLWLLQQREALRRIAAELRRLGTGAVDGTAPPGGERRFPLSVDFVPELDASELLEAAAQEARRVRVTNVGAGAEGGAPGAGPRSSRGQGEPVDIWRVEEGGVIRYLLGEREGAFPWVVVSLDAGEAHAAFEANLGISIVPSDEE